MKLLEGADLHCVEFGRGCDGWRRYGWMELEKWERQKTVDVTCFKLQGSRIHGIEAGGDRHDGDIQRYWEEMMGIISSEASRNKTCIYRAGDIQSS